MVDILFFGHGEVCHGPFMPGTFAFNDKIKSPNQDIEKAKALLKEAGYDADDPLEFEIITSSNNQTRVYAVQIIQHQLRKAGIKAKIRTMEWQAFLNTVVMPHQFEAVLMGWSLSLTPDAYSIWHSDGDRKGGFNFIGYHNPEVDKLIVESEKIIDPRQFAANYQKLFKQIVEDYPYIFLYIPNSITAVNKQIKGIEPSIIGIDHNQIDWTKK